MFINVIFKSFFLSLLQNNKGDGAEYTDNNTPALLVTCTHFGQYQYHPWMGEIGKIHHFI